MTIFFYRGVARLWRFVPELLRLWLFWTINPKVVVGVSGVLLNQDNQVLLLKHRFHRSSWGLPGGWIERGERLEDAWRREVWEETRYRIRVDGLVTQKNTGLSLEFILRGRLTGGQQELDPREILDAAFFSADALPEGLYRDHLLAIQTVFSDVQARVDPSTSPASALPHELTL